MIQEAKQKQQTECTFRPQLESKNYKDVVSEYAPHEGQTFSEKLKQKLKAKQAAIAQARRAQEYDELKDCTFKPKVN